MSMFRSLLINKLKEKSIPFVAVGTDGFTTSEDGITWTDVIKIDDDGWQAICWNGYKFVAVGGSITTSEDGKVWSDIVEAGTYGWNSVACNISKFVAVGGWGHITTSIDGITWTDVIKVGTGSWTDAWNSICWNGSKFVIAGNKGFSTSVDGIVWTDVIKVGDGAWNSICWNGSKFVAVGNTGNITSSTDGITWTDVVKVVGTGWNSVCCNASRFVAAGSDGFATSIDGLAWTDVIGFGNNGWQSVCWNGYKFVAAGSYGFTTSRDGISWSEEISVGTNNWQSICCKVDPLPTKLYAWHYPNSDDGDIVTYAYNQSDMQYYRDSFRDLILQDSPSVAKYDPSGSGGESVGTFKPIYTLYTFEEHPKTDSVLRVNTGLNVNDYRNENGSNAGDFVAVYTLNSVSNDYLTISCRQDTSIKYTFQITIGSKLSSMTSYWGWGIPLTSYIGSASPESVLLEGDIRGVMVMKGRFGDAGLQISSGTRFTKYEDSLGNSFDLTFDQDSQASISAAMPGNIYEAHVGETITVTLTAKK